MRCESRGPVRSPAFCSVSMFWGLVACSATICTNRVRAFWYSSNTAERGEVEKYALGARPSGHLPTAPTLQHLPLAHGRGARVRSPRPLDVPRDCSVYPHSRATSRNRNAGVPAATVGPRYDVTMVDGVAGGTTW